MRKNTKNNDYQVSQLTKKVVENEIFSFLM